MDETIFNDEQNNLVIHYTENETSKTLRFPVLTDSIDMDDDIDIKMEKMLKDKKGVSMLYSAISNATENYREDRRNNVDWKQDLEKYVNDNISK